MNTTELVDQVGIILGRYQALQALTDATSDPEQINTLLDGINQELERTLDNATGNPGDRTT